jgi:hypothetical protein
VLPLKSQCDKELARTKTPPLYPKCKQVSFTNINNHFHVLVVLMVRISNISLIKQQECYVVRSLGEVQWKDGDGNNVKVNLEEKRGWEVCGKVRWTKVAYYCVQL